MADQQSRPVRAAIFARIDQAERAVEKLLEGGFEKHQISVICSDDVVSEHFSEYDQDPAGADTGKGILAGGGIGMLLGGFAALTGVAATGGVGLAAAGALASAGISGPFVGAMMTRGFEKETADFYDQAVSKGKILVAAEDQSERSREALAIAEKVFAETGSEPIKLREG